MSVNPTEDWLDARRKFDGAEGLWRIHNKLYDFTIWSRTHPGGKFWLEVTQGTDITETFESHHLSDKAETLLHNFYIRDAVSPRNSFATFRQNGFFKAFKRKIQQQNIVAVNESKCRLLVADCLAVGVFITSLLATNGNSFCIIVSGILLGMLSISSHDFLHSKDNWRINYFNMSLMSYRDWRIIHVLSHHAFRQTLWDLEFSMWQPFIKVLSLCEKHTFTKTLLWPFIILQYALSAHIQFLKRFLAVFLSKKLRFYPEEVFSFVLPLFLYAFSNSLDWSVFIIWNLIIIIGSFVFCLNGSTSSYFSTESNWSNALQGDEKDFGITQLSQAQGHSKHIGSLLLPISYSYRTNYLHYFCPTFDCRRLNLLLPAFGETCNEFGISTRKDRKSLQEGIWFEPPQGHVFFS